MEELARAREQLDETGEPQRRRVRKFHLVEAEILPVAPEYEEADLSDERDLEIEQELEELENIGLENEDLEIEPAFEEDDEGLLHQGRSYTRHEDLDVESGPMDSFSIFMRQASQYKLLSPKQEVELAKRIEDGDIQAKELMVNSNIRLVVSNSRRYLGHGLSKEDLIQEGMKGLIRATEKFQWRKGFKFSTYATWWIRQAMQRALQNQSQTIRKPVHIVQKNLKLHKLSNDFNVLHGREPNIEELSELSGFDPEEIEEVRIAFESVDSLYTPIGDDESDVLANKLSDGTDVEGEVMGSVLGNQVLSLLSCLEPRSAQILMLRYGLNGENEHTYQEIAKIQGVSVQAVKNREMNSLTKLRIIHGDNLLSML